MNVFIVCSPFLSWLMTYGVKESAITRYDIFRPLNHELIPQHYTLSKIQEDYRTNYSNGCKYTKVNPMNMTAENKLHIEYRGADGCLSPSLITLVAMLCGEIFIHTLNNTWEYEYVFDSQEFEEIKKLWKKISNPGTGFRESDTTDLDQKDIRTITQMTHEIINTFGGKLPSWAENKLHYVAESPPYKLALDNKNWEEIEEIYSIKEYLASELKEFPDASSLLIDYFGFRDSDIAELFNG